MFDSISKDNTIDNINTFLEIFSSDKNNKIISNFINKTFNDKNHKKIIKNLNNPFEFQYINYINNINDFIDKIEYYSDIDSSSSDDESDSDSEVESENSEFNKYVLKYYTFYEKKMENNHKYDSQIQIIKDIYHIKNILNTNSYNIEHFIKLIFNSDSNIFNVIENNQNKLKDKIYELIDDTPSYLSEYHSTFAK